MAQTQTAAAPTTMTMATVDEAKINDFERNGYVVLPGVLPAETIASLTEAADRWLATDSQRMRQTSDGGNTDGFRDAIGLDPAFMPLLAWPTVLPYLVRLLDPGIKLLTSHIIYRYPAVPGTPANRRHPGWHRDFAKAQRSLGDANIQRLDIKAAFCLTDLPVAGTGGTLFVPGSHLLRAPLPIEKDRDPAGAVEPILRAGDCVLFENRTWHAGGPNLNGDTRKVIMMGYTYVWIEASDYTRHNDEIMRLAAEQYGDIGLQLLCGLQAPETFDFDYDSRPLREWVAAESKSAAVPVG